jgi:transcriptional regulator with XRE-family HTH domain
MKAISLFLRWNAIVSLRMSMKNLTLFGKRLRSIRGKRSRADVAEAADISLGYLGELERGEKWPTLDVIVALARANSVSPADLFELESETVDPKALRKSILALLDEKDTKELQQALRLVRAAFLGK